MEFRLFEPMSPLQGFIEKIWFFEKAGRLLLLIPFRNELLGNTDQPEA